MQAWLASTTNATAADQAYKIVSEDKYMEYFLN
jgi:hypothetical protein